MEVVPVISLVWDLSSRAVLASSLLVPIDLVRNEVVRAVILNK